MGKHIVKQQKTIKKEDHYLFSIKHKKNANCITVDFSPVKALALDSGQTRMKEFSVLPTFNPDRKHYSQTFFNPYDGLDNDARMKETHEKRVMEMSTMIHEQSIMKPKPKRKNYCWVCLMSFDDYLEHIESDDHSVGIKFSRFNNDIMQLIDKYGQQPHIASPYHYLNRQ